MSGTPEDSCAEGPEKDTSPLPPIDEIPPYDKCPRCLAVFDYNKIVTVSTTKIPLVITCKHTLCEDCIRRLLSTCPTKNVFVCPVCDRQISIPRNYAGRLSEFFVPHYALMGYLMWRSRPSIAASSHSHQNQGWVSSGQTLRTKGHPSFSAPQPPIEQEVDVRALVASFNGDIKNSTLDLTFERCPEHPDNYLNIVCQACNNQIICCYCFVEKHSTHVGTLPVHLYKLSDEEGAELQGLKKQVNVVFQQLLTSKKRVNQAKTFDISHVDFDLKKYFYSLHASLHSIEKELGDQLKTLSVESREWGDLNTEIDRAIYKLTQIMNAFEEMSTHNKQSVNVKVLLDEARDVASLPCRLVTATSSLDPIRFVSTFTHFEQFRRCLAFERADSSEHHLVAIEDWDAAYVEGEKLAANLSLERSVSVMSVGSSNESSVTTTKKNSRSTGGVRRHSSTDYRAGGDNGRKVIVTHVNNFDSFYVQTLNGQNSLLAVNKSIARAPKTMLLAKNIELDRVYGVLYVTKNIKDWRRGRITSIHYKSPDEANLTVFYVDYGNEQQVTIDKLKQIPFTVSNRQPWAQECKLVDSNEFPRDNNSLLQFADFINHNELYMRIHGSVGHVREVDLMIQDSTGQITPIGDLMLMLNGSCDVDRMSDRSDSSKTTQCRLFKNSKVFAKGQKISVVVTHIADPDNVFIQLESNLAFVEKLRNDIQNYHEKHRKPCVPLVNTDVIVKFDGEKQGSWHRGRIVELDVARKTAEVDLVDWGPVETIPWSDVRVLTENFVRAEEQAIKVKLADVDPMRGAWTDKSVDFLRKQLNENNRCNMMVGEVDGDVQVALFQATPSADLCLNALLVEHNFAVSTGKLSETVYWPYLNGDEDIQPEEDDLASGFLKKAEDILSNEDDPDLSLEGLKQEVSFVKFDDPNGIYVKFLGQRNREDEMNKELQIHYSSDAPKQKKSWKSGELCVVYDYTRKSYVRGKIMSKDTAKDSYIVSLYDQSRELKILGKNVFVYENSYFGKYECFVYKCRLGHIEPAGGSKKWSPVTRDILRKIFDTYKTFFIKKVGDDMAEEKTLSVLMWYARTLPGNALEPCRIKLISVNKALVESGYALLAQSSLLPGRAEEVEVESRESSVEKHESDDRAEKKQQPRKRSQSWYDMMLEDECSNDNLGVSKPVLKWPDTPPIEQTTFLGVLMCISSNAVLSVRTQEFSDLYQDMEDNMNLRFGDIDHNNSHLTVSDWRLGEMCSVLYEDKWYRGVVTGSQGKLVMVEMIDFGSEHMVQPTELSKNIMYPEIPPFLHKVQLYDIVSKTGEEVNLDVNYMIENATASVQVDIKSSLTLPIPYAEIILSDGTNLNNLVVEADSSLTRLMTQSSAASCEEGDDESYSGDTKEDDVDCEDAETDDDASEISSADNIFTLAPIPPLGGKNRTKLKVVDILTYNSVVLDVSFPINIENDPDLMADLQAHGPSQPSVDKIKLNHPCICERDGSWCRGFIYSIDNLIHDYIVVFLVDFGVLDYVEIGKVKKIKEEWLQVPVYKRIAAVGIKLEVDSQDNYVMMQMKRLQGKVVDVGVISVDPLTVQLYEGNKLFYQNFVSNGILRLL